MPAADRFAKLSNAELILLLKDLQRRFDAGPGGRELLQIIDDHATAYGELKRRGLTDTQIEWALSDRPQA